MKKVLRILLVTLASVLVAIMVVAALAIPRIIDREPLPWSPQCAATVDGKTVRLNPSQARYAAVIAGVASRRGLPTQAVVIALTTAWQESGLRNLDYGDRDSLGLFQQRPSQGWGTAAQVSDPVYASNAFYSALLDVKGWQTRDVGDVAQDVQRSGHPDAYDKHVERAGVLAKALAGDTPAAFTCSVESATPSLEAFHTATKDLVPSSAKTARDATAVRVTGLNQRQTWAFAAQSVALSAEYGVHSTSAAGKRWTTSWPFNPGWTPSTTTDGVEVRFA